MSRITNQDIIDELSYIKGKVEYAERFSKEHRLLQLKKLDELRDDIKAINGRVRATETTISWFKGITAVFSILIGWIFKKTM